MDKAILMMAITNQNIDDINPQIEELINLSFACEIEILSHEIQNIKSISNAYFIGSGKLDALKNEVEDNEANLVVFNVGLSPTQIRNLEGILNCDVIDKNMLILEIFKRRAKTPEAKAQVEIANLKYMFPRMAGSYETLGRQVSGFGNRNRGLGETKLELDRRAVDRRIQKLERELEKYKQARQMTRKQKLQSNMPLVALVGYTNAGKSSLMNVLQDKKVFVEDMLFASLETYARRVDLDDNHHFILHDTVGFIQDLPHNLINAFHSTLEEVSDADLLLHVIDYSNPNFEKQKETVVNTLESMGVHDIPMINVFNKIDLTENKSLSNGSQSVFISTETLQGIDDLKDMIIALLWKDYQRYTLKIPYDKMGIVNEISTHLIVLEQDNDPKGVVLEVYTNTTQIQKYQVFLK
ncbi:MAG: GTPase HflX [Erysipelothrix sp.]|nr:GTPase HflX [Erysipelothrix sp.]